MAPLVLAESEVDVCASCGGLWLDWFDGEVRRVATEVLAAERTAGERGSAAPDVRSNLRNEVFATGACPRCSRQLVVERYVLSANVKDAGPRASISTPTGADLLRCEECAGVFAPRTSAALLATLPPDEEPPPSSTEGAAVLEPLPWQRLLRLLRRVLGAG